MKKEEILNKVGFDIDKAKAVYEWLNDDKKEIACNVHPNPVVEPVSIHYDNDGNPDGVRVCIADEDFIIGLYDAFDGKEVEWLEIEKSGIKTFTKKQAALLIAYLDEVNEALVNAGGEKLERWYWTMSEYSATGAWFFYGTVGTLTTSDKCYIYGVRPVLASVLED